MKKSSIIIKNLLLFFPLLIAFILILCAVLIIHLVIKKIIVEVEEKDAFKINKVLIIKIDKLLSTGKLN